MSFDCRECPDYARCISPCADVRQYIGQDYVKKSKFEVVSEIDKELVNSDYKVEIYTRMKQIERMQKLTPRDKQILKMSVARIKIKEIAKRFELSEIRIKQIIAYYRGK